jgi:dephospho-CoA kinase
MFALRRILNTTPHLHIDGRGWSNTLGVNVPDEIKLPFLSMGDILLTFKAALEDLSKKDTQTYESLSNYISSKIQEFHNGKSLIENLDTYFEGERSQKIDLLAVEIDNWTFVEYPLDYSLAYFVTPIDAFVRTEESFNKCYNIIVTSKENLAVVRKEKYNQLTQEIASRIFNSQATQIEDFKSRYTKLF